MNLNRLFIIHAIVTFAAGVVLIAAPEKIPNTVGIHIDQQAYFLCYLLGSAELALAFLSYFSRTLTEYKSLRLISFTFIAFHFSTAAVELYAFTQGASVKLFVNMALRIIIAVLFLYYGVLKTAKQVNSK